MQYSNLRSRIDKFLLEEKKFLVKSIIKKKQINISYKTKNVQKKGYFIFFKMNQDKNLKHMQHIPFKKPNKFLITNFMPFIPLGNLEATKNPKESIQYQKRIKELIQNQIKRNISIKNVLQTHFINCFNEQINFFDSLQVYLSHFKDN
ncbi:hypothetical protein TTHERM_000579179 (macronuclear) [Tetrahymena thermophila SB210]|uniref:Uncharacterized protein n=1 Tax=Tetrahymena thermophila (strain SB210) TaxID=312017 RepID=W7X7W3_TETTS|nr:hypothetical protein TTHERM_000579179 [Tetrahymena thermophila SB210]EWS72518.1 hypothetical protein TTHERM_000579179 [Tetrahymena thermophila SB210]|eukprot:XP_012654954.1 hypothetical protein TTHERM_000579179 [Tetrahymena thermophila SB210]